MARRSMVPIPMPPYRTGPNARLYIANQVLLFAAKRLGVPVEVLDYNESLMAFGRGQHRVYVHKEILPLNDRATDWIFEHKWLAHILLSDLGAPVPETWRAAGRRFGWRRASSAFQSARWSSSPTGVRRERRSG
ncbi:MAG: hypothetical protein U0514_00100 [Candidatus Andersenbacteria bacterium]